MIAAAHRGGRVAGGELESEFCVLVRDVARMLGAMDGDAVQKEGGVVLKRHKYRICEVAPRDKRGRPRRIEVVAWVGATVREIVKPGS